MSYTDPTPQYDPPRTTDTYIRKRARCEYPLALAPNAITSSLVYSTMMFVDEWDELIVTATLATGASVAATVFQLSVITFDPVYAKLNPTPPIPGILLPGSATLAIPGALQTTGTVIVTAPGTTAGVIAGMVLKNFGAAIAVGVSATSPWDLATADGLKIGITMKA